MYKKVTVKIILLLGILLIFCEMSKIDEKNDPQVSATAAPPVNDSSELSNDLVYRSNPKSVTVQGDASVSVNIPKSLFEDIKNVKVVIYDIFRDIEIISSDIDLEVSTVYTYQINEEGSYSIYAVTNKDDQTNILDLSQYVTVYNVSSGDDVEVIQIK